MYEIKKIINGEVRPLHMAISSYESAYDILLGIASMAKKQRKNIAMGNWQLNINNGEAIYQITN